MTSPKISYRTHADITRTAVSLSGDISRLVIVLQTITGTGSDAVPDIVTDHLVAAVVDVHRAKNKLMYVIDSITQIQLASDRLERAVGQLQQGNRAQAEELLAQVTDNMITAASMIDDATSHAAHDMQLASSRVMLATNEYLRQ